MIEIVIHRWGLTMDEAVLTHWYKGVGDTVVKGEPMAEVETDKASGEIESPAYGAIVELLVEAGTAVVPGQFVGRIESR